MNKLIERASIGLMSFLVLLVAGFFLGRITGTIGLHNVPSGSMEPTLPIGSHFVASIFPYWRFEPARGEIITFIVPRKYNVLYVKRIIGLPGDKIQMRGGQLVLNGRLISKKPLGKFHSENLTSRKPLYANAKEFLETLPSGKSYRVLDLSANSFLDNTAVFIVPPAHYFVMGDNRDNSMDSRLKKNMGFIPYKNIRGKFLTRNPLTRMLENVKDLFDVNAWR